MSMFPETADIETASDDYATRFSGKVGEFFLEMQLKKVVSLLEKYDNPALLDVGGGHGQLAVPLIKAGYDVTVTGSDDSCETQLKKQLSTEKYSFLTCNSLALPYPDNAFDVVLAFRLVPHTQRWQELLKELSRVARQGIIIDYPDIRSANILNAALFKVKKIMEGNTRPFELFSRAQICDEFKKYHCHPVGLYPEFFLPMVLHRKLGSVGFSRFSEKIFAAAGLTSILGSPIIVHLKKVKSQ